MLDFYTSIGLLACYATAAELLCSEGVRIGPHQHLQTIFICEHQHQTRTQTRTLTLTRLIMLSILDALTKNAQEQPDQRVWTFLNDHAEISDAYTYKVSHFHMFVLLLLMIVFV